MGRRRIQYGFSNRFELQQSNRYGLHHDGKQRRQRYGEQHRPPFAPCLLRNRLRCFKQIRLYLGFWYAYMDGRRSEDSCVRICADQSSCRTAHTDTYRRIRNRQSKCKNHLEGTDCRQQTPLYRVSYLDAYG